MKMLKPILVVAILWLFSNNISAQCTPDPNCTDPDNDGEFCPDTIPELMEGFPYDQVITFTPPPEAQGVVIHHLANVSVSNLISGINYSVYASSFYPGQWYCIELYGTPAIGTAGIHNMYITFDVYISILGFPINVGTFTDSSLSITVHPMLTADFMVDGNPCLEDTTEITYTGSGTIAASYNWDLDSGTVVGGNYPDGTFQVQWTNSGLKEISLEVEENGYFTSDTFQILINPMPIVDLGSDIALSPTGSVIDAGAGFSNYLWSTGETTQTITVSNSGFYSVLIEDINSCTNSDTIEVFGSSSDSQQINLVAGWSMFSTYIEPTNNSLDSIFSGIVSDINIMKDYLGFIYWPAYGIDNIHNLTIGQGYLIKMINSNTLNINGVQVIPEITPIYLPMGWSMIAYLRTTPALIQLMLSSINYSIIIAKNDLGQVYWPQFILGNFIMAPGEGYLIKMSAPEVLIYPAN
ncbi:MAG: hypothetical protein HN704_16380 [Bacteroidetes bacterium]|jgi:hypothetical protein|nr:hypothetical protein [Bacteroidota bacterium]MBT6687243.1 hypothetical protein [Bacteroidota bacterium]MBT7144016.1 hypothetical protein [Bacteroidota bacterium]MBT7493175.1 hypothetical protein [Bacteroidota bacterium]